MTEKEIVYTIYNMIRGGNYKNKDLLSERMIRKQILSVRANMMLNFSSNGRKNMSAYAQDFIAKMMPENDDTNSVKFIGDMPKLIAFDKDKGLFGVNNYVEPMSTHYGNNNPSPGLFDAPISRHRIQPIAIYNNRIDKLIANIDPNLDFDDSTKYINKMKSFEYQVVVDPDIITLTGYEFYTTGVLYNPEQVNNYGGSYDWETDQFPMPQTLESPLIMDIRQSYDDYVRKELLEERKQGNTSASMPQQEQ